MRSRVAALGLACFGLALAAAPAFAQSIAAADAQTHVGQTVTVEGAVSDVHQIPNGITFIDIGGHYPDNVFTAVILADDAKKFPDMMSFNGKTVDITGAV